MTLTPRQISLLGALSLIPLGIYAAASGHLTLTTTVLGVLNIVLIVGSLVVLFGSSPNGAGHSTTH